MQRFVVLLALTTLACAPDAPNAPNAPETPGAAQSATTREPAPASPWPATARVDLHDTMVASTRLEFHASDGGGKAWLERATAARCRGEFSATLVYEAGPLGVADGGMVFLQVSPYWGWSSPQAESEGSSGYTRVATDAEGLTLRSESAGEQLLVAHVGGRALRAGERVRFEYGVGARRATADNFAESDSRFWVAVDGDGDGVRKVLDDSPFVAVEPGPPAGAVAHAPSVLRANQTANLSVALLDAGANACRGVAASFELVDAPPELELALEPSRDPSAPAAGTYAFTGAGRLAIRFETEGTYRLKLRVTCGEETFEALTNPIVVAANAPRIQWADLHGHSARSDGTGTPAEYYEYARDFAALDAVALTDHDHWGLLPLSSHGELVEEIVAAARAAERPDEFTALVGFEWTSWLWGHRNVVYFDERSSILSSLDERFDAPLELRDALRGSPALSIPHHPAGGPIALDWASALEPDVEPLIEVCSAHGVSESDDSPRPIYSAHRDCFARAALERGATFGMLASGDSHDGHPGLCHLGGHYPTGGVAAILADDNSRPALLAALRARRVYATSGPRIVLRFALGSHRMGETVPAAEVTGEVPLFVQAIGTAPIESIEVVRKGDRISRIDGDRSEELALSGTLAELVSGDWIYARVVQSDGSMAWSSPIFVR
ncbi:MAG: CehA/McbA family metallohydrolase [Planctomycetes bacterium]|nr:CehA/McbA family metallohydrolase [Planctomycetota bacterium]